MVHVYLTGTVQYMYSINMGRSAAVPRCRPVQPSCSATRSSLLHTACSTQFGYMPSPSPLCSACTKLPPPRTLHEAALPHTNNFCSISCTPVRHHTLRPSPTAMLIGLCGLRYAGKRTISQYLAREHGFEIIEDTSAFQHFSAQPPVDTRDKPRDHPRSSRQRLSCFWKHNNNGVIAQICPHDRILPDLLKRPYFLLVFVEAPFTNRVARALHMGHPCDNIWRDLVLMDDHHRYLRLDVSHMSPHHRPPCCGNSPNASAQCRYSLAGLERLSRLRIHNNFDSHDDLQDELRTINFTDTERLRPSWDTYFMSLAKLAAERTNCMKRRVGCVIVRNKRIVATGYNGTPSGVTNCLDGGCARCNGAESSQGVGLDLCLCLHAEENAIIESGRERCQGGTLYTNLFPCILCAKKIVQSGMKRIVFEKRYATDKAAEMLLTAGGVSIDQFGREDVALALEGAAVGSAKR